jgi:hypothetical protein
MGYLKYIEESKQKVYNQTVATKIMDLVQKLRLSSNEHDQRRWIWELIQNAKDVAFENHPVSICVDLIENEDNEVIFRHNGKPFSIDNVTFLIEQVSTKERNTESKEKNKPTGKFGTGFLTTHLLAETVEVDSVVKEEDLPYKKFSLLLDRSGREINDVIRSVNGSLKILRQLDDMQPYTHYKPKDFNTSFKYLLDDEGVETAKIGLEDLNLCVAYTLVFVPNIESVCINSETTFILQPEVAIEGNGVEIHTILKKITGKPSEEIHIATVSNENVTVAVEIKYEKNQIVVVEPNESLPRLFCDFPLIGTEDFIYPVVINSPFFNPTEARNGIYITDRSDNIIVENKKLLIEARDLYLNLLSYSATHNWQNLWVLANTKLPKSKEWVSKEWVSQQLLDPVRTQTLKIPLVDTILYDRIPIDCGEYNNLPKGAAVDFPKLSKKSLLPNLWSLCNNAYFILPIEKDYLNWAEIIWAERYFVGLENITTLIEKKGDIDQLAESLQKDESQTKKWMNDFYTLLDEEGEYIKNISGRTIFLNQNGKFKKKEDLIFEKEIISDTLKDIVNELGTDFREKLLDLEVNVQLAPNAFCNAEMVAGEITKLIRPRLAEIQRTPETKLIFKKLYLWFNQNAKQADEIFDFLYKNKHKLLDDEEIVSSIEKADFFDSLLSLDANLSPERILELLELEELSKGFSIDKTYTPTEEQKRINFMNGWKGEAFVYKKLLEKEFNVTWVNKSDTTTSNEIIDFEGETHYIDDKMNKYDLEIKFPNGHNFFVQVKSTSTDISRADDIAMPISVREWNFINEKSDSDSYYLARVFNVSSSPEVYFMRVDKIETI